MSLSTNCCHLPNEHAFTEAEYYLTSESVLLYNPKYCLYCYINNHQCRPKSKLAYTVCTNFVCILCFDRLFKDNNGHDLGEDVYNTVFTCKFERALCYGCNKTKPCIKVNYCACCAGTCPNNSLTRNKK